MNQYIKELSIEELELVMGAVVDTEPQTQSDEYPIIINNPP